MNTSFVRTNFARAGILAAALSVAVAAAVVVPPKQAAHAATSSCVISPGLAAGAFREGISCLDGIDTPGGGYSPGRSVSACNFVLDTTSLPFGFLDFLSGTHTDSSMVSHEMSEGHVDAVNYVRDGRLVAIVTYVTRPDHTFALIINNMTVAGFSQVGFFDCSSSRDGIQSEVFDASDLGVTPAGTPVAPPGTPAEVSGQVLTSSAISALPGRPGEYLLRIDVSNTAVTETPIDLTIDSSAYSVVEVLGSPRESRCTTVELAEACTLDAVDPGLTKSFVFHVKAVTGASATSVHATVSNAGMIKMPIYVGAPNVNHRSWVANNYRVDLPVS